MATRSRPPAAAVDPEAVLSHRFPEVSFAYDERDVALYALGVGACGADAVDEKELHLVYHRDGQPHIKALPTFASLFPFKNNNGLGIVNVPGLNFDASLLLHGQQYIEIYKPIPSGANIVNKFKVAGLHDKGKATILEIETTSHVKDSGEVLCMNRSTLYLRGAGGFSDSSRPYSYVNYPINQVSRIPIPNSAPSAVYEDQTQQSQALLYRLSGDYNPLHSDPMVAQVAGFTRPILHGLCSLGFATRAVIKSFCHGDPTAVKSIFGRFLLHVYPGETLVTEMWFQGQWVLYQTKVKERNRAVLSGYVLLKHIPSSLRRKRKRRQRRQAGFHLLIGVGSHGRRRRATDLGRLLYLSVASLTSSRSTSRRGLDHELLSSHGQWPRLSPIQRPSYPGWCTDELGGVGGADYHELGGTEREAWSLFLLLASSSLSLPHCR